MANIGIIINSLTTCGGEERVVSLMANEWIKGNKVTIYTYETRNPGPEEKNDYYLSPEINVEKVSLPADSFFTKYAKLLYHYTGMINTSRCRAFLQKLYYPDSLLNEWVNRLRHSDLDIIIAISGNNTMLLGLIQPLITQKTIGWEHSSYEGYFNRRTGAFKNRLATYVSCARRLNQIVVLNDDIQSKFNQCAISNTTVISNPRSFSMAQKASMSNHTFITCGRIEAEKGYFDLVRAFHQVHQSFPDWKLIIVGGGSLQRKLEKLVSHLKLSAFITVTGYVKNVQSYLLQASVYVITSRWEGFPMSITEALEAGLPVIGYDIPALKPLITPQEEGIIVPAFDSNQLAAAMKTLAGNTDLRTRMSEKAILKSASLSPEQVSAKWNELFQRL